MRYAEIRIIRDNCLTFFLNPCSICFRLGFIVLFLLNTSCTRPNRNLTPDEKKRDLQDVFASGTADSIYSVKKFQVIQLPSAQLDKSVLENKALKIRTAGSGERAKVSMSTIGTFVDPSSNVSFVNQYSFLDYKPVGVETVDQKLLVRLLGKVKEFKGFPNTVYYIVPRLEGNALMLYRLSDPGTVPYDELPLSIKVGEKVATPLVGYSVDYCVAERILNANHEETGESRPKCGGVSKKSAKYIRLIEGSKTDFEYLTKVDVFPHDFFKGQWFFVKTIVKSSKDAFTGFHQSFSSANLIEFGKTPNSLKILDASGYEIEEKDQVTGFSIPVNWTAYKVGYSSDIIHRFKEEEDNKSRDVERPYFKIRFKELIHNEVRTSSDVVAETEEVFITDDYFSFTIKVSGELNIWVKYAFKKAVENSNYVERRWFEEDSFRFFPVFSVLRKYYKKAIDHTKADKERFKRVTRFDPMAAKGSVKVIKWYFSKQTPKDEWLRNFGRRAAILLDKEFQEAGKDSSHKIRVVLDESEDRELGDIRYNIINLILSPQSEGFLLGYGPNVANPITGEVLSGTANVWVTQIIDRYVVLLRRYIRFHVYPPAWKLLPESPGVTDFMQEKIQKLCSSGESNVTKFIADEKKKGKIFHPVDSVLNDKDIVRRCARKLAEPEILYTTVHEMRHGFGYRHLFSGSADVSNFYTSYDEMKKIFGEDILTEETESYKTPPEFSSVMDYGYIQFPFLTVPGKYDIAATKFLYFNKVELVSGGTLDVPAGADRGPDRPQRSITEVVEENRKKTGKDNVKKYKVCGGKSLDALGDPDIHPDDPLCARFDYGKTPLEVVENMIRVNWDVLMINRNRYDSERVPKGIPKGVVALKYVARLYNQWVIKTLQPLLRSKGMESGEYSFLDPDDVKNYQNLIQAEAEKNPEFKLYYDVRRPVFEFYKKLFFLPLKHCVYNKKGTYEAIALRIIKEKLSNQYSNDSREILMNCQSPIIEKWAHANNKGDFVTEVGYFSQPVEYFLKAKREDPLDELSPFMSTPSIFKGKTVVERIKSGVMPQSVWYIFINSISQAVLQEPDFSKEMVEEQMNVLFKGGIDLNPYIDIDEEKWVKRSEKLGRDLTRPLPRFLSYGADHQSLQYLMIGRSMVPFSNFLVKYGFIIRQFLLEHVKEKDYRSAKKQQAINEKLMYFEESMGQKLVEIFNNPYLYKDVYPAVVEVYEEYRSKTDKGEVITVDYFLNHPAICVNRQLLKVIIPFTISEENYHASLCRKFNEYKRCINSGPDNCENIEDKQSYVHALNIALFQ